ncbi:hypothetical protein FDA94_01765 [Herbidospora galbida]|uniref:Helix-turn-helix domain-containing protein n=1 Tax=Herbidospora galbida TaxID=2575442 RepID=A0A4U3MRK6_9ACTN|nr:hypothetical protein [Herbidospora galbida]TKK91532.1 hypothetical protein FDA94_01765 [Herbidospora galbida]
MSSDALAARPDPAAAHTDAEFVAMLQRLKTWSGRSYRDIQLHAQRAGHHLPYSTAAGMLKRRTLPRQEAVTAFVLGCGLDEQAAAAWHTARTRLDLGLPPEPEPEPEPQPEPVDVRPRRRRWTAAGAALAAIAAALLVVATVDQTEDEITLSGAPAQHGQPHQVNR